MDFFEQRRFLVTGGKGFLGSYVVKKLKERGALSAFAPSSNEYDLREKQSIQKCLQESQPDIVIHLAARVGGIGANAKYPAEFFYDNLMMGTQLFHESWRKGIEKFVAIGTVCAYPKWTPVPFREESLWNGYPEETNAPYGLSKKMLLVQSQAYRSEYGFVSIFVLPANLYGPGDHFDLEDSHVIPALIQKFIMAREEKKDSVVLWGDGSPTREFLFVEDCAEAILLAVERYEKSEPVNIGSGEERSIQDIAEQIKRETGYAGKIVWDMTKPNGQPRRKLDTTKAKERFGFEAETPFEEGIKRTVAWAEEIFERKRKRTVAYGK